MKRQILTGLLCIFFLLNISAVRADWTPDNNEIAPSKDTYLSISGVLSEPTSNFGGAETLDVGDGFKGVCMTLISFDLSSLLDNANSLLFTASCVTFGDATWNLHVSIIMDDNWDELQITTVDNDLNVLGIYTNNSGNVTDISITGSTDEISINLTDYLDISAFTLVFSPDITVESNWITMESKENGYLTSISNPPHLVYEVPPDENDNGGSSTGIIIGILAIAVVVVIVVLRKKKKFKN